MSRETDKAFLHALNYGGAVTGRFSSTNNMPTAPAQAQVSTWASLMAAAAVRQMLLDEHDRLPKRADTHVWLDELACRKESMIRCRNCYGVSYPGQQHRCFTLRWLP